MNALWCIELLGRFRALGADRTITRFSTQKTAALLAYLALYPGRSHSRDSLFELLWPECDPDAGRNRLSVALSSLRRQLEPPPIPSGAVIQADRHTVRLAEGAVESDAAEFLRLLDSARLAESSESLRKLEAAMELFAGELLPGFYDDWIDAERSRMSDRALQAMRTLAANCALRGDTLGALEWKRRCEALDAPAASEAPSVIEREARSRSGTTGTQLTSVRRAAVKSPPFRDEQAPRREPRRPHLPLRPNRFFGREEELKRLGEWLSLEGATRVVTLTGPGGGGKSRLALEAAHRLGPAFKGETHFVALAEATCGRQVTEAVLSAVGGRLESGECPLERLSLALGGRPSLIVLDNFEQLVEMGGVEALCALVETAPEARWLVTSRRRLGLQSEAVLAVPPLPLPEATEAEVPLAPEDLLTYDGVRLFVERAQGARPDFQITHRNASVIDAICRKLEGLPLALELAAARAQVLSPAQMLATLEERLAVRSELLISRQRDRAARHRTFEAAIEWSYELLPSPLQTFLAGLSVFHGGWSAAAASAVCDRPDALESLADLTDCSLIRPESGTGDQRFEMLEMVREFAADRFSASEHHVHSSRHARWYVEWLEARVHAGMVKGPLSEIEAELPNLRAALRWAQEFEPVLALRLATAAEPFLHLRGLWAEAKAALDHSLSRATDVTPELRAEALVALGHINVRLSDRSAAQAALDEAEALARQHGMTAVEALATRYALRPALEENEATLHRSLALAEQTGDAALVAGSAVSLGNFLIEVRRADEAQTHYARALELFRALEDPVGEAQALNCLGAAAMDRADWDEAQALLERALELRRESGDTQGLAMTLFNLGAVWDSLGDKNRSRQLVSEARREYEKAADFGGLILCLRILGDMACEQGCSRESSGYFRKGLDMAVARRDSWAAATILQGLVPLLSALDKKRAAVRALGAALEAVDGYWERLEQRAEGYAGELSTALGEPMFDAALGEGRRLSWQELIVLTDSAGVNRQF